jgi:hypothetical protein
VEPELGGASLGEISLGAAAALKLRDGFEKAPRVLGAAQEIRGLL